MNDEGIGIAGWLLADLTLVLALIFLAVVPGRAATPPAAAPPPVIADIGCSHAAEAATPLVICEPSVEGEEPLAFAWEVEGGDPEGALDAPALTAGFGGAGWVKLVVRNAGGETDETYPVIPPPPAPEPTPEPTPEAGLLRADFRFDQLVLSGIGSGPVSRGDIANARVREKLRKEQEDTPSGSIPGGEWATSRGAELRGADVLRRRQREGYRIALIETFSHAAGGDLSGGDPHIRLSEAVNEAFFGYLRSNDGPPDRCIFLSDAVSSDWTANYRDRTNLASGSSRINLYFVWAPGAPCAPPP